MPAPAPSALQHAQLFSHTYDIDTIIHGLCAAAPQWLETTHGTLLSACAPGTFQLDPLPASFLNELAHHSERRRLNPADTLALDTLLPTLTVQTLPAHFENARLGGWLRERVKEAALEWLDLHNLIPPSLKHINRQTAAKLYASTHVTIESPE